MSLTYTRLSAVAKQVEWQPDVMMLILGGFIVRICPNLDPDKFADATAEYAKNSGLPADMLIEVLCKIVDDAEEKARKATPNGGQPSQFAEYLAGVMNAYRKNSPAAPPTMVSLNLQVPHDVTCDIDSALKSERPLTDTDMGDAIVRWNAKLTDDRDLYLDVINAEPTPALSITVTRNKKTEYRHRPIRLKQWGEMKTAEGGSGKTLSVGFGSTNLALTFCY